MSNGPTTGASEESAWSASPRLAFLVRLTAFSIPFFTAFAAVHLLGGLLFRPEGLLGLTIWAAQAAAVGLAVSVAIERMTRRLLPLAALLNMSLVFPDRAPARFSIALRAGTVRQLSERLASVQHDGLGSSPSEAAAKAIELISLISNHDRGTRGHTERVRAYSDLIAEELGLSDGDRNKLAWAALLHDIGKLTVPSAILNKNGQPTADEWATLRTHPSSGSELLAPLVPWLGEWLDAAAQHHERWDGGGYPSGLVGTEISLAGRIVAVADAYDVITSKRSYKKPMSTAAARQELVDCAGSHFDPAVVRAFLNASVGRHWSAGPLAWLVDFPRLGGTAGSAIPTAPALIGAAALSVASLVAAPAATPSSTLLALVEAVDMTSADGSPSLSTPSTTMTLFPDASTFSSPPTSVNNEATSRSSTTARFGGATSTPAAAPTTSLGSSPTTQGGSGPSTSTTTAAPTTTTPTAPTTTVPTTTAPTTTAPSTTATALGSWAVDNTATGSSGAQVMVWILENDQIPGPVDTDSLRIVTGPEMGTAELVFSPGNPTNTRVRYLSPAGFDGIATMVYEVCTTDGQCARATLTITVNS